MKIVKGSKESSYIKTIIKGRVSPTKTPILVPTLERVYTRKSKRAMVEKTISPPQELEEDKIADLLERILVDETIEVVEEGPSERREDKIDMVQNRRKK